MDQPKDVKMKMKNGMRKEKPREYEDERREASLYTITAVDGGPNQGTRMHMAVETDCRMRQAANEKPLDVWAASR